MKISKNFYRGLRRRRGDPFASYDENGREKMVMERNDWRAY